MGFRVAPSLPERGTEDAAVLRPVAEVARRLAALNAVFAYAAAPESAVPGQSLKHHIDRACLREAMTPDELAIIDTERQSAQAEHGGTIGWRSENAYALAWVLGLNRPLVPDGTMLDGEDIQPLVMQWPPMAPGKFDAWAAALKPRSLEEVAAAEDLFYCAHNAVRSAQVEMMEARGKPVRHSTIPADFDPVANGGVIHERRHSLTWAVSPGVAWDDTDLNT